MTCLLFDKLVPRLSGTFLFISQKRSRNEVYYHCIDSDDCRTLRYCVLTHQSAAVMPLTHENFDQVVDGSKNVFVKFYAPVYVFQIAKA